MLYKRKKARLYIATGHKGIVSNYIMMCVFILIAGISRKWVQAFFISYRIAFRGDCESLELKSRRYFLIFYQVNIGFELIHVIPKCVNNIFSFYLASGIQHCNEHHKEHAEHADCHTAPREHKIDIVSPADYHTFVNQPRRDCRYGKPKEQRPHAIKGTLEIHHLLEIAVRHPHRAEHCELPPTQLDIRGNGVEHIGNRN